MYAMNWNQIVLSLMASATLQTALATITHVGGQLALTNSRTSNTKWSLIIFSIFQFPIKLLV